VQVNDHVPRGDTIDNHSLATDQNTIFQFKERGDIPDDMTAEEYAEEVATKPPTPPSRAEYEGKSMNRNTVSEDGSIPPDAVTDKYKYSAEQLEEWGISVPTDEGHSRTHPDLIDENS
jgi:hypothetical protein